MQVELSEDDLEVLEQALVAYERGDGGVGMLMGKLLLDGLCPPEYRAKQEREMQQQEAKEQQASRARRIQASIVRAKLFNAQTLKACMPG